MSKRHLLLVFTLLACSTVSFAWGPKGHSVVAEIAQRHISKKTQKKISEILEGKSMVYYSTWMDGIRGIPKYAHTYSWHFLNVDPGYTYQTSEKDPRGDVYSKTLTIIDSLKSGALTKEQEKDQLRYLIHMVADMHCPMHVGYKYDLGGNRRKVMWFSTETNLHSVWDSKLIESAHAWSYTEWADNVDTISSDERARITSGTMEDWLSDILTYRDKAYKDAPEGSKLGYNYINTHTETAEKLLLHAGLRLAKILDEIYN